MHAGKKKLVWCVIVCYVFKEWKHMSDLWVYQLIVIVYSKQKLSKKHNWFDNTSWTMIEILHDIIIATTTKIVSSTKSIDMSFDEVISVNNYN